MILEAYLHPAVLLDTPRLFTAIAEWLAVFVYFNIYKRRLTGVSYIASCIVSFLCLAVFHFVAGILPLWFWIPNMVLAVILMYIALYMVLDIKRLDCGILTAHAFVLAEFAASLYRQLYVWFTYLVDRDEFVYSFLTMLIIYGLTYQIYYHVERGNFSPDMPINASWSEFLAVAATGIGAFIMGNISFVSSKTPFSASDSMLYVRTLVDFGGMLMLMTQMGRRNELAIKNENDAINQLFQKQYEQYKLAIDNSELLRREMHDMKHYLAALKGEEDPGKREEVLADMEQAIAIQESFMNTGNQVLDVILTTKSLQCEKQHIMLNAMIDGDILSGIHVKDLCSLFGNILDNAIEATQQVQEMDKRIISLSCRQKNQFIIIECENYSDNPPDQVSSRALPQTTKGDNVRHGFGLKSIQKVAEKYGGAMTIRVESGWFKLKVLLAIR